MVFVPTESEMAPEAEPEVTTVPFAVTVAVESVIVGVTVNDDVELPTEAEYEVVADAKVGDREPVETFKAESVATAEPARVTVTVYVLTAPLSAVTKIVMVFEPTLRLMAPDAVAEVTAVPFTLILAKLLEAVGVTVIEVVALLTDTV